MEIIQNLALEGPAVALWATAFLAGFCTYSLLIAAAEPDETESGSPTDYRSRFVDPKYRS